MTLVNSYKEEGFSLPPEDFLNNEEYAKAIQNLVVVCTDIVIVDKENETIYLAKRKSKPMNNYWWIGGRMKAGETKEESAIRCFKRETGLDINISDLKLEGMLDFRFKNRQQIPQDFSCHTLSYVFSISLSSEEIFQASTHLDRLEYDNDFGLKAYSREELITMNVFQAVIDIYDFIFKKIKFV